MATADIIKEFLVPLGFKIDEAGLKKFVGKIEEASKEVFKFVGTMTAAATAVGAAVADIADRFEDLYWASQRIGATASNIQTLKYAASQFGISGEAIQGTLEGLARTMRENPGLVGLLNGLGVKTQGRQTTDILTDFVGRLRKMPFFVAQQYASQFGVDSDTLFMLEKHLDDIKRKTKELADEYKDAGVDANDAADKGHRLMTQLRHLEARVNILGASMVIHATPIADWLNGAANKALDFAFNLDKVTHGWSTLAGAFLGSWETLSLILKWVFGAKVGLGQFAFFLTGIARTLAAGLSLQLGLLAESLGMSGVAGALTSIGAAIEATPIGWILTALAALAFVGYEIWKHWHDIGPMFDRTMNSIKKHFNKNVNPFIHFSTNVGKNLSENSKPILQYGLSAQKFHGSMLDLVRQLEHSKDDAVSKAQGSGHGGAIGRFQMTPDTTRRLGFDPSRLKDPKYNTMVAAAYLDYLIKKYHQLGAVLVGYNSTPKYVKRWLESHGNLGVLMPETQKYLLHAQRLGADLGADVSLGGDRRTTKHVEVHAKSDIHVHGSDDPRKTANIVRDTQRDHVAGLVRNLEGALQ